MKSLKRVCLILLTLGMLLATACHEDNTLLVGVDISQIPLSFRDSQNAITGFEVDMATEAAKRAGMTVAFVPINWAQKEQALSSGKVNCLWGKLSDTKKNEENLLFTGSYMTNRVILVVSSSSSVANIDGLAGKAVGTIKSSDAATALLSSSIATKIADSAPQYYSDNNTAFAALESAQIEAVAVDDTMGNYYINQNTFDYKILPDILSSTKYAVGVRRNDSRLRNALQSSLVSMSKDGTSKALSMKWFNKDYTLKLS